MSLSRCKQKIFEGYSQQDKGEKEDEDGCKQKIFEGYSQQSKSGAIR